VSRNGGAQLPDRKNGGDATNRAAVEMELHPPMMPRGNDASNQAIAALQSSSAPKHDIRHVKDRGNNTNVSDANCRIEAKSIEHGRIQEGRGARGDGRNTGRRTLVKRGTPSKNEN
jgi:hypothetical protein